MCSAAEYLTALSTRQKQTLQNKGEMKNGDIRHLIIERNGVFVASEEHTDDSKGIFFAKTQNPTTDFYCWKTLAKRSQKFLEQKILGDHHDGELSLTRC